MAWGRGEGTVQDTNMQGEAANATCSRHQKVHRLLWGVRVGVRPVHAVDVPHGLSRADYSPAVGAGCKRVMGRKKPKIVIDTARSGLQTHNILTEALGLCFLHLFWKPREFTEFA